VDKIDIFVSNIQTAYLTDAVEVAAWIRDKRLSIDDRLPLDSMELVDTYIGEVDSILQQLHTAKVQLALL